MRLGVTFIAPRQLGAVESIPGRQFLPSVAWRTGQSGAPPDTVRCGSLSLFGEADRCSLGAVGAPDCPVPHPTVGTCHASRADSAADRWPRQTVGSPDSPVHHRTLSGADLFPYLAKPTVAVLEPLAHRTLSGAHPIVWCPFRPLAHATRRARIPRPTVGPADRWLTGQSGAPPDSPVIYSRTSPTIS
jgi:hypothetical protein